MKFPIIRNALRMIDVIVLLRTSTQDVKGIADATGFSSTRALDRVFKGWFYVTPSAFRSAVHTCAHTDAVAVVQEFRLQHPQATAALIADQTGVDFGFVASLG